MAEYDLAVLGGGPGGYVAALRAAQLGARVALVEKQWIGGTCLNIGCIPTKALMSSAEAFREAARGEEFGFTAGPVAPAWPRMVQRKQEIVDALVGGVERLLNEQGVTVIRGVGQVRRPGEIEVTHHDGDNETATAHKLILATGSVPASLPVPGANLPGVITSTEALSLPEIPGSIVIVGGGVIGVEFAALFHALGSRVTVIEMLPTLLAGQTEPTIAKRLQALFRRRGIQVLTGSPVQGIEPAEAGQLAVQFGGPKGGLATGQWVLIAAGRWPHAQGLEAPDLRRQGRSMWVDEHLATSLPDVYAIGDLIPGPMLAHVAMVEGRVAAENALGGNRRMDYRSTPNVVFTIPEVASVGLTEAQAHEQGAEVKVSQFPLSASARALTLGQPEGLVRLVCEAGSGRLLGMHLMGARVTDLIAEGALAVQLGATADDLAWTVHAHPTLPEAVLEATLGYWDSMIHYHKR
jgi:dihydrolipoamide dehydrogenase